MSSPSDYSASTLSAEHSNVCLPLSVISDYRASSPESEHEDVPDSPISMDGTNQPLTDVISNSPAAFHAHLLSSPPWWSYRGSTSDSPSAARDAPNDDHQASAASVYSPSGSASPTLVYPTSMSPIDRSARVADHEACCSMARSSSPSVASERAHAANRADSVAPNRSPSPLFLYCRRSTRISSLPKRSLAEMEDDELEREFEDAAEAGPSTAPYRSKRRKTTHVDPEEHDYVDSDDDSLLPQMGFSDQVRENALKGKAKASKRNRKSNSKGSTQRRNKVRRRKKHPSNKTCMDYPDCDCPQCPDCELCFSRRADLTRHYKNSPAHQVDDMDAVYAVTNDTHRVWCGICKLILQRADARLRHEKKESCGRARWTKSTRKRRPPGGPPGDRDADPGAMV